MTRTSVVVTLHTVARHVLAGGDPDRESLLLLPHRRISLHRRGHPDGDRRRLVDAAQFRWEPAAREAHPDLLDDCGKLSTTWNFAALLASAIHHSRRRHITADTRDGAPALR